MERKIEQRKQDALQPMKALTCENFFLKILHIEDRKYLSIIDSTMLEQIGWATKDAYKIYVSQRIATRISDALKTKEGDRLEIVKEVMSKTPFDDHFHLLLDYKSKKCEEDGTGHLFYYLSDTGDMIEASSDYSCLYCGKIEEKSRRTSLSGEIAPFVERDVREKLDRATELLGKIRSQNVPAGEILEFVRIIMQFALGV